MSWNDREVSKYGLPKDKASQVVLEAFELFPSTFVNSDNLKLRTSTLQIGVDTLQKTPTRAQAYLLDNVPRLGKYILVAGVPGSGKTSACLSTAIATVKSGKSVAIVVPFTSQADVYAGLLSAKLQTTVLTCRNTLVLESAAENASIEPQFFNAVRIHFADSEERELSFKQASRIREILLRFRKALRAMLQMWVAGSDTDSSRGSSMGDAQKTQPAETSAKSLETYDKSIFSLLVWYTRPVRDQQHIKTCEQELFGQWEKLTCSEAPYHWLWCSIKLLIYALWHLNDKAPANDAISEALDSRCNPTLFEKLFRRLKLANVHTKSSLRIWVEEKLLLPMHSACASLKSLSDAANLFHVLRGEAPIAVISLETRGILQNPDLNFDVGVEGSANPSSNRLGDEFATPNRAVPAEGSRANTKNLKSPSLARSDVSSHHSYEIKSNSPSVESSREHRSRGSASERKREAQRLSNMMTVKFAEDFLKGFDLILVDDTDILSKAAMHFLLRNVAARKHFEDTVVTQKPLDGAMLFTGRYRSPGEKDRKSPSDIAARSRTVIPFVLMLSPECAVLKFTTSFTLATAYASLLEKLSFPVMNFKDHVNMGSEPPSHTLPYDSFTLDDPNDNVLASLSLDNLPPVDGPRRAFWFVSISPQVSLKSFVNWNFTKVDPADFAAVFMLMTQLYKERTEKSSRMSFFIIPADLSTVDELTVLLNYSWLSRMKINFEVGAAYSFLGRTADHVICLLQCTGLNACSGCVVQNYAVDAQLQFRYALTRAKKSCYTIGHLPEYLDRHPSSSLPLKHLLKSLSSGQTAFYLMHNPTSSLIEKDNKFWNVLRASEGDAAADLRRRHESGPQALALQKKFSESWSLLWWEEQFEALKNVHVPDDWTSLSPLSLFLSTIYGLAVFRVLIREYTRAQLNPQVRRVFLNLHRVLARRPRSVSAATQASTTAADTTKKRPKDREEGEIPATPKRGEFFRRPLNSLLAEKDFAQWRSCIVVCWGYKQEELQQILTHMTRAQSSYSINLLVLRKGRLAKFSRGLTDLSRALNIGTSRFAFPPHIIEAAAALSASDGKHSAYNSKNSHLRIEQMYREETFDWFWLNPRCNDRLREITVLLLHPDGGMEEFEELVAAVHVDEMFRPCGMILLNAFSSKSSESPAFASILDCTTAPSESPQSDAGAEEHNEEYLTDDVCFRQWRQQLELRRLPVWKTWRFSKDNPALCTSLERSLRLLRSFLLLSSHAGTVVISETSRSALLRLESLLHTLKFPGVSVRVQRATEKVLFGQAYVASANRVTPKGNNWTEGRAPSDMDETDSSDDSTSLTDNLVDPQDNSWLGPLNFLPPARKVRQMEILSDNDSNRSVSPSFTPSRRHQEDAPRRLENSPARSVISISDSDDDIVISVPAKPFVQKSVAPRLRKNRDHESYSSDGSVSIIGSERASNRNTQRREPVLQPRSVNRRHAAADSRHHSPRSPESFIRRRKFSPVPRKVSTEEDSQDDHWLHRDLLRNRDRRRDERRHFTGIRGDNSKGRQVSVPGTRRAPAYPERRPRDESVSGYTSEEDHISNRRYHRVPPPESRYREHARRREQYYPYDSDSTDASRFDRDARYQRRRRERLLPKHNSPPRARPMKRHSSTSYEPPKSRLPPRRDTRDPPSDFTREHSTDHFTPEIRPGFDSRKRSPPSDSRSSRLQTRFDPLESRRGSMDSRDFVRKRLPGMVRQIPAPPNDRRVQEPPPNRGLANSRPHAPAPAPQAPSALVNAGLLPTWSQEASAKAPTNAPMTLDQLYRDAKMAQKAAALAKEKDFFVDVARVQAVNANKPQNTHLSRPSHAGRRRRGRK